jgi:cysteine desulfurase/selenocysteine lyase
MIRDVDYHVTSYAEPPLRFEAGTPPIAQAISLGAAIDYLASLGWDRVMEYENNLYQHLQSVLDRIPGLRKIGEAEARSSVQSFLLGDAHPYDVGLLLDSMGVAVRTGHHCGQPLMKRWNLPGTVRASVCFYNTVNELDYLGESLLKTQRMLGHGN